jgi:Leucine-rich repeat (LRR) protein
MKAVLKLLVLPLALIILFTQCEKEPEIHPEDPIDIPDDAFLTALIEEGVDTNGDRLISYAEAEVIISLDVNYEYISNLSGIEAFENLDSLYCSKNLLTYLDISGCAALKVLHCNHNQLTSLDVSNNSALIYLESSYNPLTSLDVSNNTALTRLGCFHHQLTSLDVSNNIALTYLNCYGNQLTSLDVSNNTALTILWCGDNQLTSLDVSNNTALTNLGCVENILTNLDVSNNTALTKLQCGGNQLAALDISNNIALGTEADPHANCYLDLENMPTLEEVCVWTMLFPPEGFKLCAEGSPNVYFTTECSE